MIKTKEDKIKALFINLHVFGFYFIGLFYYLDSLAAFHLQRLEIHGKKSIAC